MSQNEIVKPQMGLGVAGRRQEGKNAEGTEARAAIGFMVVNVRPAP